MPDTLTINTLGDGWCDKDMIMLHACFQLLTNCIEEEQLLAGNTDWAHDELHANAKKEIGILYAWWNERKKLDAENKVNDLDEQQYATDNEMLIRLIKVRQFLWT